VIPTFQPVDDRPGVTVIDPVENRQYPLQTGERVAPARIDASGFYFPVDSAVSITTSSVVLPYVVPVYVRNPAGELLIEIEHYDYETLPDGEYILELMAPIKLYLRVRSGVTIASSDDRLSFDFDMATAVRLGARSRHERPAATVETTAQPADLARAVSTFGSALKTTSPERSLPTFRGHPPRLSAGDAVRIPEGIDPPRTGVRLVVPPERIAVYAASPLAYYLGATVETGSEPRLETDRGFTYALGRDGDTFDRTVGRVLKHAFFFDCVLRTEGFYRVDLHEREQVEARVDLPFDELYDRPLADRLESVLSVPFERIRDLIPTWQLVTHTTDEPANVSALPFLANDLAIVRRASAKSGRTETRPPEPIDVEGFTRSGTRTTDESAGLDTYVSPPPVDAFEQAWLGTGVPIGANKLVQAGFEHGLDASPSSDGVEVTVVCTDREMAGELDPRNGGLYGDREALPFDVTVRRNVSTDELRRLFTAETNFLHYVGHVEDGAFVCRDGTLAADELTTVGVDAFLINGCRSYEIGLSIVERGSVGGIVTLSEVGNRDAISIGRFVARLLNNGFTLRSALSLARAYHLVGAQYVTVGDGGVAVGQAGSIVPNSCRIERVGEERYRLRLRLYHVDSGVGAQYIPYLDGVDRHFLAGNELPAMTLSGDSLSRFLRLAQIAVEFDGERCWSTDDRFTDL
jgi:hypothetical protein